MRIRVERRENGPDDTPETEERDLRGCADGVQALLAEGADVVTFARPPIHWTFTVLPDTDAAPVILAERDWNEIYAALEIRSDQVMHDDADWKAHLQQIMESIGPDGYHAASHGVAPTTS